MIPDGPGRAAVGILVGGSLGSLAFLATAGVIAATGRIRTVPVPGHPSVFRTILLLGIFATVEEAIFRAGVLGLGQRWLGFGCALALSMASFAVVHAVSERFGLITWLNLLLVGAVLGLLYQWAGFLAAVGFHWAWNAWQWGLGFAVSGPKNRRHLPSAPTIRDIDGLPYGPEGHWAALLALAASVGFVGAFLHR